MLTTLFAAILAITPAALPDWQNPAVVERGRLPMHASFTPAEQETIDLSGEWKFYFNETIDSRLKGFEAVGYDDSSWGTIPVSVIRCISTSAIPGGDTIRMIRR